MKLDMNIIPLDATFLLFNLLLFIIVTWLICELAEMGATLVPHVGS
jgi:hypothetical protein